jgi:hypothetical protein
MTALFMLRLLVNMNIAPFYLAAEPLFHFMGHVVGLGNGHCWRYMDIQLNKYICTRLPNFHVVEV